LNLIKGVSLLKVKVEPVLTTLYLPEATWYRSLVSTLKKNQVLNLFSKKMHVTRHIEIGCIEKYLKGNQKKHLLDVGCGDGYWTNKFSRYFSQTSGIDPFEADLAIAKRYKEIDFKIASAEDLPYADNTFDVVVSVCVFEHLYSDEKAFNEINRTLKKGGNLLATVDSLTSPAITKEIQDWHKEKCYCKQLYTKEQLTEKLHKSGFVNIKAKYIISNRLSIKWELITERLGFAKFFLYPFIYFPIKFLERNEKQYGYKLFIKATKAS
jgi:ubiquinone/menaquinone biosynthesis C-methylase UbiE